MTDKLPKWPKDATKVYLCNPEREDRKVWAIADYWKACARLAVAELNNIRNAERFKQAHFENGDEFADWARSRARYTVDEVIGPLPEQQP